MAAWIRAAHPILNVLTALQACWLVRVAMACAFVHVVDEGNLSREIEKVIAGDLPIDDAGNAPPCGGMSTTWTTTPCTSTR